MSNAKRSLLNRVDGVILMLYILLVLIGLLAVFSVEHRTTDVSIFLANKNYSKQFMWFGYSLFVGMLILLTDSKFFSSTAFLGYATGMLLLILTLFIGVDVKGSRSWISLGSIRMQPGELCKIFTSLAMAKFLSMPETNFKTLKDRLIGLLISLGPAIIILAQNETGLALVYFCFILVMYREGLPSAVLIVGFSLIALGLSSLLIDRTVLLIAISVLTIAIGYATRRFLYKRNDAKFLLIGSWAFCILFSQLAVPMAFKHVLKRHQIDRIYSMLGKEVPLEFIGEEQGELDEKKGNASEYNVLQSKIAIGSGGLVGKGFLNGTSTKNQFVPEQNTDFIFCAIGEQFGFLGSAILVGLYLSLMLRILYAAERQRSPFTRVYAYSVASILFFHFAVNISMTIGLAPVIGITLPFLSYGGSSLLTFSILIFILLRLDADRHAMIR